MTPYLLWNHLLRTGEPLITKYGYVYIIGLFSGIPQGKLIKRHRLPCNDLGDCWHWKDLNLGIDVTFYGKIFHIYNCDNWTRVR